MTPPVTYAEWSNLLDKFAQGDDTVLDEMSGGSFVIDSGTAIRFYKKAEEAYKRRKQLWLDKFNRALQLQIFKTQNDFEITLRNAKQNLQALQKYISLKGLPEDLKSTFKKDLEEFVSEIKKSMKTNISKNTAGYETILIMLSSFNLGETLVSQLGDTYDKTQPQGIAPLTARRKIIF